MHRSFANSLSRATSAVMLGLCALSALLIATALFLVLFYLTQRGIANFNLDFFTQTPGTDTANPRGVRHAIEGTLILVALAALIAIPLGMLVGVYLSEYASDRLLPSATRFICDVLTGVPSIVVGILGYELIVVPMGTYSGYAGAAALAFIMVPIIARTTEEMLRLVPKSYREASLGLGATKSQTILRVVLPASTGSVVTGILLAVARAAGETAPLLFTALSSQFLTRDPSQPFPSLTVQVYTYATGPWQGQQQMAITGMLVLVMLYAVLSLGVRWWAHRATSGGSRP